MHPKPLRISIGSHQTKNLWGSQSDIAQTQNYWYVIILQICALRPSWSSLVARISMEMNSFHRVRFCHVLEIVVREIIMLLGSSMGIDVKPRLCGIWTLQTNSFLVHILRTNWSPQHYIPKDCSLQNVWLKMLPAPATGQNMRSSQSFCMGAMRMLFLAVIPVCV